MRRGWLPVRVVGPGRERVIATARRLAEEAATGAPWPNADLAVYLDAFAAWLADADGYYLGRHTAPPGNGWTVVDDGLSAATVYE